MRATPQSESLVGTYLKFPLSEHTFLVVRCIGQLHVDYTHFNFLINLWDFVICILKVAQYHLIV